MSELNDSIYNLSCIVKIPKDFSFLSKIAKVWLRKRRRGGTCLATHVTVRHPGEQIQLSYRIC